VAGLVQNDAQRSRSFKQSDWRMRDITLASLYIIDIREVTGRRIKQLALLISGLPPFDYRSGYVFGYAWTKLHSHNSSRY
jgi:hypothetical protein